ncbi:hypothetical protein NDU88_001578 [Pleurodeles waltl]|uniref:Uncharacterized protein n=1 Tax=Pleurodeles waltl TaxID=8319 RepID=A0AAV7WIQ5_PLEWA|nr:hypothetical protein NDU88_001578 [Pleurodeles waltl]
MEAERSLFHENDVYTLVDAKRGGRETGKRLLAACVILLTYFEGGLCVMSEDLIQQASALLEEAGRLDLLTPEAHPHARPARRASAVVAVAVAACSPPRRDADRKIEVSLSGRSHTRRAASIGVGGQKATRLAPGDRILKRGSLEVFQGDGCEGNVLQFGSGSVEHHKRRGRAALIAQAGAVKGRGLGGGGDLRARRASQFVGEGIANTKK